MKEFTQLKKKNKEIENGSINNHSSNDSINDNGDNRDNKEVVSQTSHKFVMLKLSKILIFLSSENHSNLVGKAMRGTGQGFLNRFKIISIHLFLNVW